MQEEGDSSQLIIILIIALIIIGMVMYLYDRRKNSQVGKIAKGEQTSDKIIENIANEAINLVNGGDDNVVEMMGEAEEE